MKKRIQPSKCILKSFQNIMTEMVKIHFRIIAMSGFKLRKIIFNKKSNLIPSSFVFIAFQPTFLLLLWDLIFIPMNCVFVEIIVTIFLYRNLQITILKLPIISIPWLQINYNFWGIWKKKLNENTESS